MLLENDKMPKSQPFTAGILCKIHSLYSSVYALRNLFPPDREDVEDFPQQSRNIKPCSFSKFQHVLQKNK